jgi:hypothetical protein
MEGLPGRLVLVFATNKGVYVASKSSQSAWTNLVPLHADLKEDQYVSIHAEGKGQFIVRTGSKEWLLSAK